MRAAERSSLIVDSDADLSRQFHSHRAIATFRTRRSRRSISRRSDGLGAESARTPAAWRHRISTNGPRGICRPAVGDRDLGRLLRVGNRRAAAHADGRLPRGAHRADCMAPRPIAIWFPSIPASPTRIAWPIGIRRFRSISSACGPIDEEYWNRYRATPKAFIPIERGQQLWSSRHGGADRAAPDSAARRRRWPRRATQYEKALRRRARSARDGIFGLRRARAEARRVERRDRFRRVLHLLQHVPRRLGAAARGVVLQARRRAAAAGSRAAAGARARSGGDSAAVCRRGARPRRHRRRCWVSPARSRTARSSCSACAPGGSMPSARRRSRCTSIRCRSSPARSRSCAIAVASIWWSLRALATASTRSLLLAEGVGPVFCGQRENGISTPFCGVAAGALAVALLAGTAAGVVPRVAGFFGAGALSLVAMLCLAAVWLRRGTLGRASRPRIVGRVAAGWRNTAYRPARSVLCIALIAFATFVIVAVEAFKRDDSDALARSPFGRRRISAAGRDAAADRARSQRRGGARRDEPAGRRRAAERSLRSLSRAARRRHELPESVSAEEPAHPRRRRRTSSTRADSRSTARSPRSPEERANPWLLLNREFEDGVVPVITDANSMTYVLHMKLGDDFVLPGSSERPIRLRLVAALVRQHLPGRAADGRAAVRAAVSRMGGLSLLPRRCAPRANTGAHRAAGITIVGFRRRRGLDGRTPRGLPPR